MTIEIVTSPVEFHLHGVSSLVENNQFGEVGMRLMNELWSAVKAAGVPTTGINHWVYRLDGSLFVGVELLATATAIPDSLQPFDFTLTRYLKHVHIGPYQLLPQTWQALKAELAARGEVICNPSLEIYGHHCDDPSKLTTTILIGIGPKAG